MNKALERFWARSPSCPPSQTLEGAQLEGLKSLVPEASVST